MKKQYIIIAILLFVGCVTSKKKLEYNSLIIENINNKEIKVIKPNLIYQEWVSEALKKTQQFKYGIAITDTIISDTSFVKEYFSKNIFFEGKIFDNNKFGYWNGYYKNKLIIETAYIGDSDSPMFVHLRNKKGKIIANYTFSIIQ